MKAYLMYPDRDFDPRATLPPNAATLVQDLELDTLFAAMAQGDDYLLDVARTAVLVGSTDSRVIAYRQDIVADALAHEAVVREIYQVAVDALRREKRVIGWSSRYPEGILRRAIEQMGVFVEQLGTLRRLADAHRDDFRSEGFRRFFGMLQAELSDEYFAEIHDHLARLRFPGGVLVSSGLGMGNKATRFVLREQRPTQRGLASWLASLRTPPHSLVIADRDEAGHQAASELRGRGLNPAADALARSTDHIRSFFQMLRCDVAFSVGCLNLHGQLVATGEPTCFPSTASDDTLELAFRGLRDPCLALISGRPTVGNTVDATGRSLVVVTGANQGGKSTFLRSLGLAQLMMQCGLFVAADQFAASISSGVFTHFIREEDSLMNSGKFDEELRRMSDIVDMVTPHGLVLFNESFASTNEREGSEIARQIVHALLASRIRVVFVTHMFDLAHGFFVEPDAAALFLRADREVDGRRTFALAVGEPLATSHGEDLYRSIFSETG